MNPQSTEFAFIFDRSGPRQFMTGVTPEETRGASAPIRKFLQEKARKSRGPE